MQPERSDVTRNSQPTMNKRQCSLAALAVLLPLIALAAHAAFTRFNPNSQHAVGDRIDELNGVAIYYNGGVNTVQGRNLSKDGYNLGLRYQCVEFVNATTSSATATACQTPTGVPRASSTPASATVH